jgi:two-component system sensor kinase FixL
MNELTDVLGAHEEAIQRALEERLQLAACPVLTGIPAGGSVAILAAFAACCRDAGPAPADAWAEDLLAQGASQGLSAEEVMTALHCLERAVRYQVVKSVGNKRSLLAALAKSSESLERIRQAYLHRKAAAAGRPRLEDFLGLAEGSDEFICLASLHGKPLYLNPAGRRLVGLSADAPLAAASLHDFYSDASWHRLRDVAVPAVNQAGRWEGRCQIQNRHSGKLDDVQTTVFLVRPPGGEKATCMALVNRPICPSDLEGPLAEAQARKNAILESSLDPIITIDHQGVITEFNRAAEQTFGHSRDEVLGTRPSEVLFPPSASPDYQNRVNRYLESGEGSFLGRRIEVTAVRAGGESFPAEMAMTISHEQGLPVLTFFIRDISKRKQAQAEQARYAAELERSNRELEQFAYVASHDLQEPLRKIRMFSDRLELKCAGQLDETGQECVQRMQSAAARMQVLIEGLLTLSRVTTRGQRFVPVDLGRLAQEVVSDLEVQLERVGGRVEVGKLPIVMADALQMRQLFQNLIGNALKFRRADEPPLVKVHGRFVHGRQAGLPMAEERVRIVVEDNGIGFDEKHGERIFGVFQRLHPRDVYEGTGVGLAICRRIVERHGGTITAHGRPGQGATFEVLLPVVHPAKADKEDKA